MTKTISFGATALLLIATATTRASAQMDHAKMMQGEHAMSAQSGQAAFAAIAEIVKALKADPNTDWSKVNIEAVRQHLIDMDDVLMRSAVKQDNIAGGVSLDITATGRITDAIRRMARMHVMALSEEGAYVARTSEIAGGARLVVTAKNAADAASVAKIRALGFAGLFVEGDHHAMHHIMLARGMEMHR